MQANMAQIELMALQAEAEQVNWLDSVTMLTNRGLPPEVVTRLEELWETTKRISGQVYNIGKIIVMKLIDFILQNPTMIIGAVIGAAVGSLVNAIPFIGQMLAPLAMAIGAAFGAIYGHRLDKIAKGEISGHLDSNVMSDLITMAKEFWKPFAEIFKALKTHFEN